MRHSAKHRWIFIATLVTVAACGGTNEDNFFGTPKPRVVKNAGAGGDSGASTSGSVGGSAPKGGSSTGTSGGTGGSSATGTGGNPAADGGTGGTGGDASASGGSTNGDSGTGDTGSGGTAGDGTGGALLGGTGGDVSAGGLGGSTAGAGAGTGGSPNGGMSGSAQAGTAPMGGAGMADGGRASGGRSSGGRGGRSGSDCTMLQDAAQHALETAQTCNLAQDASSCSGFMNDECGCKVPVNDPESKAAHDYKDAVDALGTCAACTEAPCKNPGNAQCHGTTGGSIQGHCVASNIAL